MDYTKWTTNNGDVLNIQDMSTKHINNCIKLIKRSKWVDVMEQYDTLPDNIRYVDYKLYKPYLEVFDKELDCRNKNNKKQKYVKLYCNNYDCNTNFLVELKDNERIQEYYICPICESLIWANKNVETITL